MSRAAQLQLLQRTIGNRAVVRVLARKPVRVRLRRPADAKPAGPEFVPADLVRELKRDNETWTLTIDGDFDGPIEVKGVVSEGSLARLMWPERDQPKGVKITLKVGITDPYARSWFQLEGITFDTLFTMEPSLAKLFMDRGLEREDKESVALENARAAFRERHDGYSTRVLNNIDAALKRITKRNPELMIAYYRYYANHELRDKESRGYDPIDFDPDVNTGGTVRGNTRINARVLTLDSTQFPTDDPVSLLAGTLIHEYTHTPQGGGTNAVAGATNEAKAYGVELFFSERMGDRARAKVITGMNWDSNTVWTRSGADKIFRETYDVMRALYEVIDQGGAAATQARALVVEFISKESTDYSSELKEFIAKVR